ncbi:spermidine/putrescine transport system ATP-binding protein (plasmid) [Azospirillum sp. B510]|uniref:ABC transporter ATP-binding protein n=1 Tax=Azospirillum sp. (strain B510) TaxID=137722 RepID=UPI0001C4BC2F|nr:spermidine/putrescine transport system ATP-binding protein [Azospirillum sp. B510]
MMPFLDIRNIKKSYGGTVAVHDVNLTVGRGEFITFLGPSGSGKSTTLYVIAGFLDPTEGDVLLQGRSILSVPSHKRNIGMVFQRYTLFPHLTVAENVAFPLRVRRMASADVQAKVAEMIRLARLEKVQDRLPSQLSGGQQQRVALARALVYNPPVLLMDEPLSALDKKLREEIQFEIKRIHQETGVTILYVTHDQEESLRLSDRIAVFSQGRIDQIGTSTELYQNPATQFVAGFVGNSDFLSCRIDRVDGHHAQIVLPDGAIVGGVRSHGSVKAGAAGTLMLRPERVRIRACTGDGGDAGMAVTIRDITFLGDNTHFSVETDWKQSMAIRVPFGRSGAEGLAVGGRARIDWVAEDAHVFDSAAQA